MDAPPHLKDENSVLFPSVLYSYGGEFLFSFLTYYDVKQKNNDREMGQKVGIYLTWKMRT